MPRPRTTILIWMTALTLLSFPAQAQTPAQDDVAVVDIDVVGVAEELAQRGQLAEAIELLREHLAETSGDKRARALLGMLLAYDGHPAEGIQACRDGISGDATDLELWQLIGVYEAQLGEDGPNVTRARGMIEYRPSSDEEAEQAFCDEHLRLAAAALRQALAIEAGDVDTATALARVLEMAGEREQAAEVWGQLVEAYPGSAEYLLGLGRVQHALGQRDEGLVSYGKAMEIDPRLPEPHRVLATFFEASGDAEMAARLRRKAAYYEWMPPFAETPYSEEVHDSYAILAHQPSSDGPAPTPEQRLAEVERLIAAPSLESTDLLAALCWHHGDHGPLEDRVYAALEQRGRDAEPVLFGLLKQGQHTCTIGHAAHSLARMQAAGLLEVLLFLLPGDVRPVFPMDIAGALDELGDPVVVPALIEAMDPEHVVVAVEPGEDVMMEGWGRLQSRQRAALALGAFDTPESRKALRSGLVNEDLVGFCAAALYRLLGQRKNLVAVQAEMGRDGMSEWVLCDYLAGIDRDEARQLHAECSARIEAAEPEPETERSDVSAETDPS